MEDKLIYITQAQMTQSSDWLTGLASLIVEKTEVSKIFLL